MRRITFIFWVSLIASLVPGAVQAASDAKEESFSFIVWGHPRGSANGVPPLHFEEILARVEEVAPDLLMVTGDVVIGGQLDRALSEEQIEQVRGDWARFAAGVGRLGIPVYVVPGNHDIHSVVTRDIFLEQHRLPPYAFSFRGSRFILLDTVGVTQQSAKIPGDGPPFWSSAHVPFDSEQLGFIRREIEKQEESRHLFFFMHHVRPWRDADGFWWQDVHPLLRGGRTRVVFSGTPADGKYLYHLEDGIHYILSCTLPTRNAGFFRRERDRDEWALYHGLDNLQYVRVEGDEITTRTLVVGERRSPGQSPRFWDAAARPVGRRQAWAERFHETLHSFEDQLLGAGIFGISCLGLGVVLAGLWRRMRRHRPS